MLYEVRHETRYAYSEPVVISHNLCHLLPRSTERQELEHLELRIEPTPATLEAHRDYFGNDAAFFALLEPHDALVVKTRSRVAVNPHPALASDRSPPWEEVVERLRGARDPQAFAALEFVHESPFVATDPRFAEYARADFPKGRRLVDGLLDLNRRIHSEFRYDPEATTLATPIEEVLEQRHGVCQDFAHLMIGCLRSLGLSARYVSGYLKSGDRTDTGAALVGSEASHAWVSAWCPGHGWIDLDPTNDAAPADQHVLLAYGRDYDDVSPLKGVTLGGGAHTVEVEVEARALAGDPGPPA